MLAEKTFNPRLGIVGGISVLGTSGVVEPMSSQALLDTIRLELNMRHAQNSQIAAVSPGNYGLDFMKETYGYDLDASVKCSNFIGETIGMAVECGFEKMLLTGHIGKLVKVRRFLWGLGLGAAYFALLMLITLGVYHTLNGNAVNMITAFILCSGGGMIGGMIS